jgi:uncharacterized protein with FMN-binding domain
MFKRSVIAGFLTTGALILLLSFKTPTATNFSYNQPNQSPGINQSPTVHSNYTGQLTGQTIQIPYGPVQVKVIFQNGQIVDVQTLQVPSAQQRSAMIAQYAAPQLRSEVLQAQTAQVNTISGATYTSQGYLQSLQSALDQMPA